MWVRTIRTVFDRVHTANPRLYQKVRIGGLTYFVVLVVMLVAFKNLWWLWLAFTLVGFVVAMSFMATHGSRQQRGATVHVEETRGAALDPAPSSVSS